LIDSPVLATILFQSGESRSPEQAGRTVVAGRLVLISRGLCEMWMKFGLNWSCFIY
jgi:hypothetical protein